MTNMTDGNTDPPTSTNHEAERAWLDRCSPEYRAVLEQALHADVEALGGGFPDSWQETRLRTEVAVGAFIDAEKRKREDEAIKRMVIPDGKDRTCRLCGRHPEEKADSGEPGGIPIYICPHADRPVILVGDEWVDPCPSWDDVRPHGVTAGSPRDERMRARYEAGRLEYREDWTKWEVARFTDMIREEEDDSTIYRAMRQWVMRQRGLL